MSTLLSPLATDHIAFMHRIGVAIKAQVVETFTATFDFDSTTTLTIEFSQSTNGTFNGADSMGNSTYTLDTTTCTLSEVKDDSTIVMFYALSGAISLVLNASIPLCNDSFQEAHLTINSITFDNTMRNKQLKTIAAYCLVHAALKSTLALTRQTVVAAMQNLNDTSTSLCYLSVDTSLTCARDDTRELRGNYAVLGEYRRRVLLTIADVKCNIERSVSTSNMSRSHYCLTLQQVAILLPLLNKYNEANGNYKHNDVPTYWGINPTAMVNGNWQLHHGLPALNNNKIPYVYIACLHLYFILFHGTEYASDLPVPNIDKLPLPAVYQYVYDANAIEDFWRETYCNTAGHVSSDLVNYFVNPIYTQSAARQLELAYCNNVCVDSESKPDWNVLCLHLLGLMDTTTDANIIQWTIADDNTVNRHREIELEEIVKLLPHINVLVPIMTPEVLKQTHLIVLYKYIRDQYNALKTNISVVAWILLFCDFVRLLSDNQFDTYFTQENIEPFSKLLSATSIYCLNTTTKNDMPVSETPNTHNYTIVDIFIRLNVYYKRYQETTLQSFYQNVFKNCDEWCYKVWTLRHLYTKQPDIAVTSEVMSLELLDQHCLFHPMLTTKMVLPTPFSDVVMQVLASAAQPMKSLNNVKLNHSSNSGYRFSLTTDEFQMQSNTFCTVEPQFNVYAFVKQHAVNDTIDNDILAKMFWHKYRCAD